MNNRYIAILTNDRNPDIVKNNMKILLEKYPETIIINEKFDSMSQARNSIIKKAKEANSEVEFIHIFHDDLIINDNYNPENYEKFMNEFNLGYYFNPRLAPMNYVFSKLCPRLIINTKKYSESGIAVFPFESVDYSVINCKKNNETFNEDIKLLFNIEYIYRCKKAGILPFLNFYFDNYLLGEDMVRDDINFSRKLIKHEDYAKEEQYLNEKLEMKWVTDSNADEVVSYIRKIKGV